MSERVVKHSFDLVFGVHLILPSTNHPCQKEEEEKKQHLRNSQISQALFQIRKIKHFRQQPPFTLPLDSSNSHFWKCSYTRSLQTNKPSDLDPLRPTARHSWPPRSIGNPLLPAFIPSAPPSALPPSGAPSFVCFRVREPEGEMKGEGGGGRLRQRRVVSWQYLNLDFDSQNFLYVS